MIQTLKEIKKLIVNAFNAKNEMELLTPKETLEQNPTISYTIFGKDKKVSDIVDMFQKFHVKFKSIIFKPVLWLSEKILSKYLIKKIPDELQFRNEKVFNQAYENALRTWVYLYQCPRPHNFEAIYQSESCFLRRIKNIFLTLILYDTAYKEFFNMLLFEITIAMNNEHQEEVAKHVIYKAKSVADVGYFVAINVVNKVPPLQIIRVGEPYYLGNHITVNNNNYTISLVPTDMCINGIYYQQEKGSEQK
jgi:hypothetical protein